jgi:hypothetical protein
MPESVLVLMLTVVTGGGFADPFFEPGDEAIAYDYRPTPDSMRRIIGVPVATSFAAFEAYEQAMNLGDQLCRDKLERRGDVFWIENGTRCRVGRESGSVRGRIVRTAREVRLLNGHMQGTEGWISTRQLRRRMRIRIEPPERVTDDNRDTPRLTRRRTG